MTTTHPLTWPDVHQAVEQLAERWQHCTPDVIYAPLPHATAGHLIARRLRLPTVTNPHHAARTGLAVLITDATADHVLAALLLHHTPSLSYDALYRTPTTPHQYAPNAITVPQPPTYPWEPHNP